MSVKILRDLLTDAQVSTIRSLLNIIPKVKPTFNKPGNYVAEIIKDPIQFYLIKEDLITDPTKINSNIIIIKKLNEINVSSSNNSNLSTSNSNLNSNLSTSNSNSNLSTSNFTNSNSGSTGFNSNSGSTGSNSNSTKYIYLPFQFANTMFNTICNYNNNYTAHNFKFTGNLFDYQLEDMKVACSHLQTYCTTTLEFSTGAGKTICASYISTAISPQLLTLVIIHLTPLIKQWKKTFIQNTNAKVWVVGEEDMPDEFDIIICMDQRVKTIDPKILQSVGLLLLDEADRLMTPGKVNSLLATQPKYIVAMTATLDMRVDGMDVMLHCLVGNIKVSRVIAKQMKLYKINTVFIPPIVKNSRGTDWNVIVRWLAESEDRNNMIVDLICKNLHHKILVMCNLIEHTKNLYEKINTRFTQIKTEKKIIKIFIN